MSCACLYLLTNGGEEHVVEEEREGDDEQHELPRVARLVEVGAEARARQVLAGHAAHDNRGWEGWMTSASSGLPRGEPTCIRNDPVFSKRISIKFVSQSSLLSQKQWLEVQII